MSMAAFVCCKDAECRRTLTQAIQHIVTIMDNPPAAAPWLLITDTASWTKEASYPVPPQATLCLGEMPQAVPGDVLVTPFRLHDFVSRVHTMVNHAEQRLQSVLPGSLVTLDIITRQLSDMATGQSVELTEKEAQILRAFMLGEGKTQERETLLREVWDYAPEVNTHTLETHISRLRAKLQHFPAAPQIVTETGGYRLQNPE